jgi:glutathione S-transferase
MSPPTLHVFAISHYCEKARFALDHLGVDFTLKHLPPGPHAQIAKKLGAPGSSLPILVAGGEVVQGSAEIITWAEGVTSRSRSLTPAHARQECLDLEKRLDEVLGVHTRRAFYSEALIEHPETVLPIFARDLSGPEQTMTTDAWPGICQLMIGMMDLGPDQAKESTRIVDRELLWLDDLLADGRSFLVGGEFSRADIAAASLLAPLVAPPEHPTAAAIEIPPGLSETIAGWHDRPSMHWIREIYRQYR